MASCCDAQRGNRCAHSVVCCVVHPRVQQRRLGPKIKPRCCVALSQMAVERAVLAHALGALAEAPGLGPAVAAVAAEVVTFAAGAIKEEGVGGRSGGGLCCVGIAWCSMQRGDMRAMHEGCVCAVEKACVWVTKGRRASL